MALKDRYTELIMQKGENVRLSKIVEMMFGYPVFTITQAAKWLNISYPTARLDVIKLLEMDLVIKNNIKHKQSQYYVAMDILNIAHKEHFDE